MERLTKSVGIPIEDFEAQVMGIEEVWLFKNNSRQKRTGLRELTNP